jgi:hypothetical protein
MISTIDHVPLPLACSLNLAKTFFKKIRDLVVCSHVFIEMGDAMYLKGVAVHLRTHLTQAKIKIKALNELF